MTSPIQPGLEFVSDMHLYEYEGRRLTSVTNAIKPLIDSQWFHDRATLIGKCVHKACELDQLGMLDESTLDDITRPYLMAFRIFKAETGWDCLKPEMKLAHPDFQYAGTCDSFGFLGPDACGILDIKTSQSPQRWWSVQLAAYDQLIRWNAKAIGLDKVDLKHMKRRVLILRPNATYKLQDADSLYPYPQALDLFQSCLKISHFMKGRTDD